MSDLRLCKEHNAYHAPPCQRCGQTDHDGVVVVSNLTMFWRGGIANTNNPTLCRQCIEDIRVFANTRIERSRHD